MLGTRAPTITLQMGLAVRGGHSSRVMPCSVPDMRCCPGKNRSSRAGFHGSGSGFLVYLGSMKRLSRIETKGIRLRNPEKVI